MPEMQVRGGIANNGRRETPSIFGSHARRTRKNRERVYPQRDGLTLVQHNRASSLLDVLVACSGEILQLRASCGQVLRGGSGVRILSGILSNAGCGKNGRKSDRQNEKRYEPSHRRKIVTMFWPPKPNELFIAKLIFCSRASLGM